MTAKSTLPPETLNLHFSADPDDAFAWWAVLEGMVYTPGIQIRGIEGNVHRNNNSCLDGIPDLAAISSASYPAICDSYVILSAGAPVGRGYGPALIARPGTTLADALKGPVAVAGNGTTGANLLKVLFPETMIVEMPWRVIPEAVASGAVSAGVAIHETLLTWKQKELNRIACLGALWQSQTNLPIPVGLVVAHRRLDRARLEALNDLLRRSVKFAFQNRDVAMGFAANYSVTPDRQTMERFVDSFTNADTLELPEDALEGLQLFYKKMAAQGLCRQAPLLDLVQIHETQEMLC